MKSDEKTVITEAIKRVVTGMLEKNIPIVNAQKVVEAIHIKEDINVTAQQVKIVMKDELGLGYRIARKVPV